jgi:hypothetical protein
MTDHQFATDFATEAAKGTPAVVMAAWTMNDVLIAISIAYVLFQSAYLFWKWRREAKKDG